MKIHTRTFGKNNEQLISITNENQLTLELSNHGARMVNIFIPLQQERRNIILGFDSALEYDEKDSYIGASIGRIAGRIKDATFTLDGVEYQLEKNDGENNLHGGMNSFDRQIWDFEILEEEEQVKVVFSIDSHHLENGFPGNLEQKITYTLTNSNQIKIDYWAATDQKTVYNPTNHTYFNLNTSIDQEIGNHRLYLDASHFGVLAKDLLPTGELRDVTGTPFDFTVTEGAVIQQGFMSDYEQNELVDGYDHPFVFNQSELEQLKGRLVSEDKKVQVILYTDRPAVVIYTANMLEKPVEMRDTYQVKHGGITLETQELPDAMNQTGFGSVELIPERPFESTTIFEIKW
ncbi:aldose epimerase family protein [Enterococcus sp. LJL98]